MFLQVRLATLPLALEKAVELWRKRKVVNFMLPICASMNFASGMMYEMAACLFFMHILGIHPDLSQQILLALACILTGIAVGGIPETSMVRFCDRLWYGKYSALSDCDFDAAGSDC